MLDSASELGVGPLHWWRMCNDFWLGTGLKLGKKIISPNASGFPHAGMKSKDLTDIYVPSFSFI